MCGPSPSARAQPPRRFVRFVLSKNTREGDKTRRTLPPRFFVSALEISHTRSNLDLRVGAGFEVGRRADGFDEFFVEDGGQGGPDGRRRTVNPELSRLARQQDRYVRNGGRRPGRGGQRPRKVWAPRRVDVVNRLDAEGLLPAITFIFSRAGCDAAVTQCLRAGVRLLQPGGRALCLDTTSAPAERRAISTKASARRWADGNLGIDPDAFISSSVLRRQMIVERANRAVGRTSPIFYPSLLSWIEVATGADVLNELDLKLRHTIRDGCLNPFHQHLDELLFHLLDGLCALLFGTGHDH